MYSARRTTQSQQGRGKMLSFVKPEFKKNHMFPGIDWQTGGYITGALWNSKDHIIRIIPGYDPETNEIYRQNININEYAPETNPTTFLSGTFMDADTVQGFGASRCSFVTSYEPGSHDDQTYGGDTVITVFSRNVFRTVNPLKSRKPKFGCIPDMKRWVAMREGTLPMPKPAILVQALLFKYQDRPMYDADGNELRTEDGDYVPKMGVVSFEGRATIAAVLKALTEPKDPGMPLDAQTNNKYGGLAELQGNKLFLNHAAATEGKGWVLHPSVQEPGKGWKPTPFNLSPEQVYAWWTPWEKLIAYMTAEEQAVLLATEFGADAVNYLVGTDPIYRGFEMPSVIAQAGYGRFSQFTDGVKEVRQSMNISVPATGTAMAPGKPSKAETALAAAFTPAKTPHGLAKPANKGASIPSGSGVPMNDFNDALSKIKRASARRPQEEEEEEDETASMANDILTADGLDDYQTDPELLSDSDHEGLGGYHTNMSRPDGATEESDEIAF